MAHLNRVRLDGLPLSSSGQLRRAWSLPRPNLFRQRAGVYNTRHSSSSPDAKPDLLHDSLKYPDPPSNEHSDIPTYISYAARTGLDTNSGTYTGTHYEYTVASALERFGFSVKRIGGKSDYGIDLLGTWSVPSTADTLRVILQCKLSGKTNTIGPNQVRELEGAFVGAPPGWRGTGVIGLLVAQKTATKGIRDALGRSRWPMGFVSCSPDGDVRQMLWNRKAEDEGLAGLGVGVRFSGASSDKQELVLTWKGERSKSAHS